MGYNLSAFKIVGEIESVHAIATGHGIRELQRLRKIYGTGKWRKSKGVALVELQDGQWRRAEIHWYEAHGIGKKEFKIKRLFQ